MNNRFSQKETDLIVSMVNDGYCYEDVCVKLKEQFGTDRELYSVKKKMSRERARIRYSLSHNTTRIRHVREFPDYHVALVKNCLRAGKSIKFTAKFVSDNVPKMMGKRKVRIRYWSLVRLAIIESRKDLTPKGHVIGYFQSVPFYSDEQAVA